MLASLTFLLVTGAVFFLALVVFGILSRAVDRYRERYVVRQLTDLSDMFLFVEPAQVFILNVVVTIVLSVFGLAVSGLMLGLLLAVVGIFLPGALIRFYRQRRIKRFNAQLVEALQQMANALKAGLTFGQAMEAISREARAPLQQEFGLFVKEVKLGVPLDDALLNMAQRVGSDDLELMATSTTIARSLGGNMSEIFETISATIRERFRLEGKIDALTSQGRLQGWIVSAIPLLVAIILNYMHPELMSPMVGSTFGYLLFATILLMEGIGILVIRRIVNIDV
jgi:tight adherence protein B